MDPDLNPSYSWEQRNQFFQDGYPGRTIESLTPSPCRPFPASVWAPPVNAAAQPYPSQWSVDSRAQRSVEQRLRDPQYRRPSYTSSFAPFEDEPIGLALPNDTDAAHLSRSLFTRAQNFQTGDLQFIEAQNVTLNSQSLVDGWKLLQDRTSPNALHDSDARYDPPRCDEDTRVEVINEITDWIKDRGGPLRLLCMTGAAGSGKSALQQTVAEQCGEGGILASAYFFSATDATRNTLTSVVPTIAYQLGRTSPPVKRFIKTAIEGDPLVFSKSLKAQMIALIVQPFRHLRNTGVDLRPLPHAVLIDGLDECMGEDRQSELLTAIKECLLADDLHFRIFIASRPEWAIRSALELGGKLREVAYHIQLSDQYDATGDMHRYLQRRFQNLSLQTGNSNWFTEEAIENLVRAASGQFIYVTTVYKYISERRASPAERLKMILAWTPQQGHSARPFEPLDILYTNILLAAKRAYEAVDTHYGQDFLLLFKIYYLNDYSPSPTSGCWVPGDFLATMLNLEHNNTARKVLVSDLHSLVTLEEIPRLSSSQPFTLLHLYHKSFSDFLVDKDRAKDLFVPKTRVYAHLAKCCMQHIIKCPLELDSCA
ncbi:hypothetical protein EST38_g5778 [Candolleomyces aberdarensis]|uniref:Nephrocystin 3-like N-terminal domain-containing protein n=1 Tax=Candolleomyces aberdarensis TaxID=2316362 RepID=A0A4Q2DLI3_9AGAR|nr:hypothetical protein EST38_g5778 [Candolleomyces aberdarensis]